MGNLQLSNLLNFFAYGAVIPPKKLVLKSRIFSLTRTRRFYMKTSRYSDSQILSVLKQAENGITVPQLFHEHGMTSATFYKWRAKYGGMDASLMARMKELEEENRRLKCEQRQRC